jgi:hypothetical protein
MSKIFAVIGLSSGVCPQISCFRKREEAKAYSKRLAKQMDFHKEDYCPRTGGWHNDENDIWVEKAELR